LLPLWISPLLFVYLSLSFTCPFYSPVNLRLSQSKKYALIWNPGYSTKATSLDNSTQGMDLHLWRTSSVIMIQASWSSGQSFWLLNMCKLRLRTIKKKNSRFRHWDFSLKGKIPIVTMVWVV
jgi:hypothetical protein